MALEDSVAVRPDELAQAKPLTAKYP